MLDRDAVDDLLAGVTRRGLAGIPETELLKEAYVEARRIGIPISRAIFIVDTLHPVYEGRLFRWRSETPDEMEVVDYERTNRPGTEGAERWLQSPFYRMFQDGTERMRRRLVPEVLDEYAVLREMYDEGQTDWIALIDRFAPGSAIGELECLFSSWTTDVPGGFEDEQLRALKRLVPILGLALKSASLARIAETLVETYLGRDAGRRVLAGRIERGVADRIEAALWFSDLRGYTRITGAAAPEHIIPFLNDYAEVVVNAVHEAGGDVLKLIGDGTLAIFAGGSLAEACHCALRAEKLVRRGIRELNRERAAGSLPTTEVYLGLHVGEVFYGNVGSQERLDFTVVGPAVNEASRIAAMCRSAERNVLASEAFVAAAADSDKPRLVSCGRFALRGVEQPKELFTVAPPAMGLEAPGELVPTG